MARKFLNKKAFYNYDIEDTLEAGIVLYGSEVKAIRAGRLNFKDSFIRIIKNEVFILNMHISHLDTTNAMYRPEENRDRKLLLHRKQIDKLFQKVTKDGYTIVATKIYFNDKNIRDLIYKGYTIVYEINLEENIITILYQSPKTIIQMEYILLIMRYERDRSKELSYDRGIEKRDKKFKRWAIFIEDTVYYIKKGG